MILWVLDFRDLYKRVIYVLPVGVLPHPSSWDQDWLLVWGSGEVCPDRDTESRLGV